MVIIMHHIISDMFTLSLPIAEKILRPILVYVFLVLLLRVFGTTGGGSYSGGMHVEERPVIEGT